ncbi:OmpH family outer membrane protein [uncultured Parabacteroides sp.]|uniref:OmpH family outer membrane protein n=1 Tax=uncultured Parabacteroides sp. TaxID=512312 RepID=UPI00258BF389|nr:OmpH family outer membrane protein [uncultured Parabacteroides sp.]
MACLMVVAIAGIQAQTRVAVLDFKAGVGVTQGDVDGISAIFGTYFMDPSSFTLVERVQIDKVIQEQGFQQSSLTNSDIVRIGQLLNLQKMVVGDVNIVNGQYNVDVRVVDVETGTVQATDGATWVKGSSYRELMKNLATRLMAAMKNANRPVAQPAVGKVVVLYGYLKVFPEDLGVFENVPNTVIAVLNRDATYGYNGWRVPTNEEMALIRANRDKIPNLGNGTYMTSNGLQSGALRLVCTEETAEELENQRKERYALEQSAIDNAAQDLAASLQAAELQNSGLAGEESTTGGESTWEAATGGKAYVDSEVTTAWLETMPDYSKAQMEMENLRNSLDASHQRIIDEFNKKMQQYEISPSNALKKEIQELDLRANNFQQQAQQTLQSKATELMEPFNERISTQIKKLVAERKCAYVQEDRLRESMTRMPEWASIKAEIEKLAKEFTNEVQRMHNMFNTKIEEYQRLKGTMNVESARLREKELQEIANRIKELGSTAKQIINEKQTALIAPLWAEMKEAVENIAQSRGYSYVFPKQFLTDAGVSVAELPDITEPVRVTAGL